MVNIVILDDNRASSAVLKMALNRHGFSVGRATVSQDVIDPPSGLRPDLILINQAFNNHSGWEIFNRLKRTAPQMPISVYVLDSCSSLDAVWIVKAVEAVIGETMENAARRSESTVKNTLFTASAPP
jgi:PleD family two-component response regulator